jgi:hypothetical protein
MQTDTFTLWLSEFQLLQLHSSLFCFMSEILHPALSVTVNIRISFPSCFTLWMWKRRLWTSNFVIFLQAFWLSTCTDFVGSLFFVNAEVRWSAPLQRMYLELWIFDPLSHFLFSCCVKIGHSRQFSSSLHHFPKCCIRYLSAKYLLVDKVEIKDSQSHVTAVTSLLGCYNLLISK